MSSNPFELSSKQVSVNLGYMQVLPPAESPDATGLEGVTLVLPTQLPGELGDSVKWVECLRPDDLDSPVLAVCFGGVALYLVFAALEPRTRRLLERAVGEGVQVVMFQPGSEDCYTFRVEGSRLREALLGRNGKSWALEAWLGDATEFVRRLPSCCREAVPKDSSAKEHRVFFMMPEPFFGQP